MEHHAPGDHDARGNECLEREVAVEQEIRDEDDQAATAELVDHPAERRLRCGALAWLGVLQRGEQLIPVPATRPRREDPPYFVIEGDQAGGVPLPEQDQRQRRGQQARVGQLGQALARCAGPGHGTAGVQHQHGAEVGLFLVLLDVQPVGAGEKLPVDIAGLVAELVRPMLGEFNRESAAGRAMQPPEKTLDDALGDQLDSAQAGDFVRIEEVESFAADSRRGAQGARS